MYDELVKRLRELQTITEHCDEQSCDECENRELCDKHDNKTLSGTYNEAADAIETLEHHVFIADLACKAEAAKAPRWIPVTERLPEKNQIVAVVQHGKTWDYGQFRGLAYLGGNIHKWNWKNNTIKTVDYWMPKKSALPEPPKEET